MKGTLRLTLLVSPVLLCGCAPDGKIVTGSQDTACSAELVSALDAFRTELGMDFSVSASDAQTIISSGRIEKPYGMAGNSYVGFFGVESASDGCHLKLYKQSIKGPGTSTTEARSQKVRLHTCQCE